MPYFLIIQYVFACRLLQSSAVQPVLAFSVLNPKIVLHFLIIQYLFPCRLLQSSADKAGT